MSIVPQHTRIGTVIAVRNDIATVELDGSNDTVTFHPSAYKSGHTEDAIYRVGTRVRVAGGSTISQAEAVWRV